MSSYRFPAPVNTEVPTLTHNDRQTNRVGVNTDPIYKSVPVYGPGGDVTIKPNHETFI